jgi:hypothetical protein
MWKVIILVVVLIIGAFLIKNVGCGCGSMKKKEEGLKDSNKKSGGCCG